MHEVSHFGTAAAAAAAAGCCAAALRHCGPAHPSRPCPPRPRHWPSGPGGRGLRLSQCGACLYYASALGQSWHAVPQTHQQSGRCIFCILEMTFAYFALSPSHESLIWNPDIYLILVYLELYSVKLSLRVVIPCYGITQDNYGQKVYTE